MPLAKASASLANWHCILLVPARSAFTVDSFLVLAAGRCRVKRSFEYPNLSIGKAPVLENVSSVVVGGSFLGGEKQTHGGVGVENPDR